MPVSERHLQVQAPAQKIWGILSDSKQWGGLLSHMGKSKRVQFTFESMPLQSPGASMKSVMHYGRRSIPQAWLVSELDPTQGRIAISLVPSRIKPCSMKIGFALRPISAAATAVDLRVEFEWTNPLFRLLSSMFPMMDTEAFVNDVSRNMEDVVIP